MFSPIPTLIACAKRTISASLLLVALMLLGAHAAHAGSLYYEFGGGVARMQGTSPFFGSSASATGLGWAVNNAILLNLGSGGALELQLGLQDRLASASDTRKNYTLQAAYPVLRIQISRIYLAGGYTPFVWRRTADKTGFQNFARAENTSSILAETGFLWPITPEFSLGGAVGAQMPNDGSGYSPKPAFDATVTMRFYFGFFGNNGSNHHSNEFEGWRYPFGFFR